MKELWRKASKLFLWYPILWLPYACAHLLSTALDSLRHAVMRRLVSGGVPIQIYSEAARSRAFWVSGVMERYLTLCLGTVALVATAALVRMIVHGEQPRLRGALADLRNYPKRIMGYSFKLWLLGLAFEIIVILPALRLSDWVTSSAGAKGWSQAINFAIPQGERFVSLILIAWIMMPIAIRLLRVPSAELPSADEKKLGRYFVILTGVGGIALSATLSPLLFKVVLPGRFPQLVYSSLISLVLSFPFLLGQIGVALIAVGGDWNPGETPAILKWRRLVRSMMPLHSEPREKL